MLFRAGESHTHPHTQTHTHSHTHTLCITFPLLTVRDGTYFFTTLDKDLPCLLCPKPGAEMTRGVPGKAIRGQAASVHESQAATAGLLERETGQPGSRAAGLSGSVGRKAPEQQSPVPPPGFRHRNLAGSRENSFQLAGTRRQSQTRVLFSALRFQKFFSNSSSHSPKCSLMLLTSKGETQTFQTKIGKSSFINSRCPIQGTLNESR